MRFLRDLFRIRHAAPVARGPISDAQFRMNVIENCQLWLREREDILHKELRADPPEHAGDLF